MKSGKYEILLSGIARTTVLRLAADSDRHLDTLILILLALGKDPRPASSRPITDDEDERILSQSRLEILYRVSDEKKTVEVGVIRVAAR